jgi:hypothetical protein
VQAAVRLPHSGLDFLRQVANQMAVAVENALAFQEIQTLEDRPHHEKGYLEGPAPSTTSARSSAKVPRCCVC